jgi:hypothetical protein
MSPTIIRIWKHADTLVHVVTSYHPGYRKDTPAVWVQMYSVHRDGATTLEWSEEYLSEQSAIERFVTVCVEMAVEATPPEKEETTIVAMVQTYQSKIESFVPDLAQDLSGHPEDEVDLSNLSDAIYDCAVDHIFDREKDNATLQDIRSAASHIARAISGEA